MEPIQVEPINGLIAQLGQLGTTTPVLPSLAATLRPIPIPIHFLPVTTALIRAGTAFGYVVTPGGQPSPTAANVTLHSGTLWFEAKLLGAAFAASTGLVGVPFSGGATKVSGNVAFGGGSITLDGAAKLSFALTSRVSPATGPAGDAVGKDFLAAKLTPFPSGTFTFAPAGATIQVAGASSVTLYGQPATLTPKAVSSATLVEFPAAFVAVGCATAPAAFAASTSTSTEFHVAGSGPLATGAVLFPIVDASPPNLPDPTDAWGVMLGVGAGLQGRFGTGTDPVALNGALLALTPARLAGLVNLAGQSTQRYPLWATPDVPIIAKANPARPDLARPASEVSVLVASGTPAAFSATPQTEAVLLVGVLDAVVDRPVAADGSRIVLRGPALALRILTAAGIKVEIGSPLEPKQPTSLALDTPNALIPVGTPNGFVAQGTLAGGTLSGHAEIVFPAVVVIPTLPDPYAALYLASPRLEQINGVAAVVTWAPAGPPVLTIQILRGVSFAGAAVGAREAGAAVLAGAPTAVPSTPASAPLTDAVAEGLADVLDAALSVEPASTTPPGGQGAAGTATPDPTTVAVAGEAPGAATAPAPAQGAATSREAARGGVGFALLDISSREDQWGIAVTAGGVGGLAFDGLSLTAPNADTLVFTVPGISWEPVVDGNSALPDWLAAFSPNDGIPTTFLVAVNHPVPLIPVDALAQYQSAAGSTSTVASFTLPFGITAHLDDGPGRTTGSGPPTYAIPAVEFPQVTMSAARALSIRGTGPDPFLLALPGSSTVGFDKANPAQSAYGALVMGAAPNPAPADFWDQQFGSGGTMGGIPVSRIDLSGFGTSMFSDWRDPVAPPPPPPVGVVRAKFDVLLGRTAHEIVQFQTWILPWSIRLQRTVVFDRSDGGEVVKQDSGWKAVDVGKFALLDSSTVMAGPVSELANVRNITFGSQLIGVGPINYVPVTFEADVVFDPSVSVAANGKNPAASVPATAIGGYADDTVGAAPTPQQVIDLMKQVGRVTGTTAGIARIGGTGETQFTLNMVSFGAAVAPGSTDKLQVALFGTPRLPKDGQWSIAKRASGTNSPQAVSRATPVPLTRAVPPATLPTGGGNSWGHGWRMLDPEDAQSVDSPTTFYGILQGTGTSKTLFEHPLIADSGQALGFGNLPGLADVGALLGVGGLFPNLGNILQIPDTGALPLQADGFKKIYEWDVTQPDRTLLDLGIVHLVLAYSAAHNGSQQKAHAKLVLDASPGAPNWSLTITNLSFEAIVDGFGTDPLLTVAGGFQAGSSIKPGFVGLEVSPGTAGPLDVLYGEALAAIKSIFSGLSDLAKSLGGGADLDVGFSGNQLSVQQGFTLPTIPLGFGSISDLGINLGFTATIPSDVAFHLGIGSKSDPFQWLVDPLAGTGAIVLGVDHGQPDVYIEAGLGLGLGIDVGIASGSASIVVSMSLAVGGGTITLGLMLTGKAEVDVLGGLASASLTLSAGLAIALVGGFPPSEADLTGTCSVGIHISICWVIDIDFDGSWSFSTSVSL